MGRKRKVRDFFNIFCSSSELNRTNIEDGAHRRPPPMREQSEFDVILRARGLMLDRDRIVEELVAAFGLAVLAVFDLQPGPVNTVNPVLRLGTIPSRSCSHVRRNRSTPVPSTWLR
jgi:hypothetical protein